MGTQDLPLKRPGQYFMPSTSLSTVSALELPQLETIAIQKTPYQTQSPEIENPNKLSFLDTDIPYTLAEQRCQPHTDKKVFGFRTTDQGQDWSLRDSVTESFRKRNLFLGGNTSLKRYQSSQCRSSDVKSLPKSPSQHLIHLEKSCAFTSLLHGPAGHNSASVLKRSLSLPHLSLQQTPWTQETSQARLRIRAGLSGNFQHPQVNSSRGNNAPFPYPEQTISQHNTRSQTQISTKGSTTPKKETFLPQPNPPSEIPPPPFDINKLWEKVRDFDCAEITDPSYIDSMTSDTQMPLISVSNVRQQSTTLEEALGKLSQEPKTHHSIGEPDFAAKLPSDKEAEVIATRWKKIGSPNVCDLTDYFFPSRKTNDESPAESSRQLSNADESPERGLVVARQIDHKLYDDQKDKSDRPRIDSIWFGVSLQSLSDLPMRYLDQFLTQTSGLSPHLDFFAGFLCVKFGDKTLDVMRDSWACQAQKVLLSHASLRRCNMDDSTSKLAFVQSLKVIGYIIKRSEVELWEMTVAGCRNAKHSKPSSLSLSRESSSIDKPSIPSNKKHSSEPAPGRQSKTPRPLFAETPRRLPSRPESQKSPPSPPMFLATYIGTRHLDTQNGVQDFVRFHFALMEWVRNGGYKPYVESVREQLWYSGPRDTPTDPEGLRLAMSEPDTIDFLKKVMRGAEQEEV